MVSSFLSFGMHWNQRFFDFKNFQKTGRRVVDNEVILIHFGWMDGCCMDEYWTRWLHLQYHALNSSLVDEWHVSSLGMKKNNVSFIRDEKELMSLSSVVMIFQFIMYYKKWSRHFAFLILLHFILLYPSDTHQISQEKGKFCKNFTPGMCDEWGIPEASTTWM